MGAHTPDDAGIKDSFCIFFSLRGARNTNATTSLHGRELLLNPNSVPGEGGGGTVQYNSLIPEDYKPATKPGYDGG